ncbi:MAG: hypothetical protein FVQ83_08865 [Chloroflexi bacterium]|nr:hypothetical protein [Chloroflexota bacterium]
MRKVSFLSLLALTLLLASSCIQATTETTTQPTSTNTSIPAPTNNPTPEPPGITWTSIGPGGGGNLTAIAFASSGTIYVGCDVGGVYRSTDDGQTWEIINEGLKLYAITEIVVDPTNPSLVYLGSYGGIYKSEDGGDHWEWKDNGFPTVDEWPWGVPIGSMEIDPHIPSTIYAGVGDTNFDRWGQGKIYKSTDSGDSWFVVNEGTQGIDSEAIIYEIAIDPQNTDIVYSSTDRGFYKSFDGGVSWERKEEGLPHSSTREVVIYPQDPNILYLTLYSPPNQTPWQGGVYKSMDGGETWVEKTYGLDIKIGEPGDHPYSTSNYEQIQIDAQNPDVVYVGANYWTGKFGVYRTTNGGDYWQLVTREDNWERGWKPFDGQRVESMAMDPSNSSRILWSETGLFETLDAGETWHQIYTNETPPGSGWWQGRGLEVTGVYDIEIDPTNSNNIYFAYADINFLRSENSGQTFARSVGGLDPAETNSFFTIVIDPDDPTIIYASRGWWNWNSGDILKSIDSGRNWTVIGAPSSGLPDSLVFTLVLDYSSPVENRTLYAVSYENGVYKSTDGGTSWTAINEGLGTSGNYYYQSLVIDPTDPQVLYAGVESGLYKTTDGGATWNKLSWDMQNIGLVEIDPQDPQILYASVLYHLGGLYRSLDGGTTWELLFSDPVVKAIAIDPFNPEIIYIATKDYDESPLGRGVFRSMDGGETWLPVNEGLSHLSIFSIEIDPNNPNILYLGTEGNGAFRGIVEE